MQIKILLTFVLTSLCLMLVSCQTSIIGVSPSTTPITGQDQYTVIGPARGDSWGVILYILPLSEKTPAGNARDRAIANSGADALIEVSEDFSFYNFLLFGIFQTSCEGTAVKLTKKQ